MASYHCTVKVGSRGTGGKHADYVQRSGAYENYKGGEELAHTESINMPSWAEHDPSEFFRQADLHERANGSAYREIEVAIPRELTKEQRVEFIREFVAQEIGTDHPCTWAIHQPPSALTSTEQPHAHIMFSERKLDGIERNPEQFFKRAAAAYKHRTTKEMVQPDEAARAKGGCPKSDKFAGNPTARKEKLVALRERFATLQNEHLEKHGHTDRVTHKSLEAQGIARLPEKHLGPVAARIEENIVAILRNRGAAQTLAAAEKEVGTVMQEAAQAQREAAQAAQAQREAAQAAQQLKLNKENDGRYIEASFRQLNRISEITSNASSGAGENLSGVADSLQNADDSIGRAARAQGRGSEAAAGKATDGRATSRFAGIADMPGMLTCPSLFHEQRFDVLVSVGSHDELRPEQAGANHPDVQQKRGVAPAVGVGPRSRYHPDNIARAQAHASELAVVAAGHAEAQRLRRAQQQAVLDARAAAKVAVTTEQSKQSGEAGPLLVPAKTLLDRLAESWTAMVAWIKDLGPLAKQVSVNVEQSTHTGLIVESDGAHAIQKTSRSSYAIHRLDALDRAPSVGAVVDITYLAGRGTVGTGPDRGERGDR